MNILILAAGLPIAADATDTYPLCLAELNGQPLIQHLLRRCDGLPSASIVIALPEADVRRYRLDNVVDLLVPGAMVVRINERTRGAACTALLSTAHIAPEEELLILNGNELIDADFAAIVSEFKEARLDAGVITFPSVHPRYSYVRLDGTGYVTEAAEKNPISRHATAGFYWFAKSSLFIHAVQSMIRKDASVNGLFYICPALNELVLRQCRIGIHTIDAAQYHPIKNERQLLQFESGSDGRRN